MRRRRPATFAVAVALALLAATAGLVRAADMSPPPDSGQSADPLAEARREIAARHWQAALTALRTQPQADSADWHHLMGYSLRKQAKPDLALAEEHYLKALRLDPGHRGANEYLGELYLMKGDLAAARTRLAVLEKLCPSGCEQRADLQRAIDKAGAPK